jgi:hypothetical protein
MQLRSRKNIRLKGYDYRRLGAYYVTICTHDRSMLFGDVVDGIMVPNAIGQIVQQCWDAIPDHMPMVVCDAFVVMPNHVHGIIMITDVAADAPVSGDGPVGLANSPTLQNTGPANDPDPPPSDVPRRPPVAIMVKKFIGAHHANIQGRRFTTGVSRWSITARKTDLAKRVLRSDHPG